MPPRIVQCVLYGALFLLIHTPGSVAADEPAGNDRMMEVLFRITGWKAEWAGPGGSGLTEVTFERRSGKVIARIDMVTPYALSCENLVTFASNDMTFDGCRDPRVTLSYDPSDAEFPFKGGSPRGYQWKLKAK